MTISDVFSLITGIALFLFGMQMMGDGLKNVAGNKLETVLWKVSNTPIKGIVMGTAVTSIIQSSSAMTVMVIGFLNAGIMQLSQAVGVIMGANIGTSITGWILSLSYMEGGSGIASLLSSMTLTGIVAVIGIVLRMFSKKKSDKYLGGILLGFAVLMVGMQTMSGSVAELKNSDVFVGLMTQFSHPILGILIGIVVAAVLQSASAAVGILQALSVTGIITFSSAFPIVMGIGIGAAAPVLLSAIGASKNGKRAALIYVINDLYGAVVCGGLFYLLDAVFRFGFMTYAVDPFTVAAVNSLFRIATALLLIPFIRPVEKLACAIVRDKPSDYRIVTQLDRLEERFIDHPALAIEQCDIVLCDMADKARENLMHAIDLLYNYSDGGFEQVEEMESTVDRYEDKLGTYMVKLTGRDLTNGQTQEVSKILHTISDFERISDHAVNLSETAREIHEKKIRFSDSARHDIDVLIAAVREIVRLSVDAFKANDMDMAFRVEPLEQLIDMLCDTIKVNHVNRVRTGDCTLDQGFVFDDMLTDCERVADHCSNLAVAMIEIQSDSFDTHEYLERLKKMRSSLFDRYLEEYSKKFVL